MTATAANHLLAIGPLPHEDSQAYDCRSRAAVPPMEPPSSRGATKEFAGAEAVWAAERGRVTEGAARGRQVSRKAVEMAERDEIERIHGEVSRRFLDFDARMIGNERVQLGMTLVKVKDRLLPLVTNDQQVDKQ
jgi:hypothetical protein